MTVLRRSCFVAVLMLAAVPRAFAGDAAAVAGCGTNGATSPKIAGPHVMPPGSYPLISTVQGEQGTVLLGFTIQPDGSISDVHVDKTSGFPRLDEAAAENVKAWRYGPSEKDGKPIACLWRANVAWKLHEAEPIFPNQGPFGIVKLGPSDYPSSALRRKETGAAAFMIAVGEDGKQIFAIMVRSSGFADLDGASSDYVKNRLGIKPAELAGKPVASLVDVVLIWTPEVTETKP